MSARAERSHLVRSIKIFAVKSNISLFICQLVLRPQLCLKAYLLIKDNVIICSELYEKQKEDFVIDFCNMSGQAYQPQIDEYQTQGFSVSDGVPQRFPSKFWRNIATEDRSGKFFDENALNHCLNYLAKLLSFYASLDYNIFGKGNQNLFILLVFNTDFFKCTSSLFAS